MTPDDPRIEREVRDALRRRDPGPAPDRLRGLVLAVPDPEASPTRSIRTALSALLGLAAVVTLAVAALTFAGRGAPGPAASTVAVATPRTSPAATQAAGPSATATPFVTIAPSSDAGGATPFPVATAQPGAGTAFDPTRDGVGVKRAVDDGSGERILILAAILVLASVAVVGPRGLRRLAPTVVAAALGVWLLAATFAPVDVHPNGRGWGLYTYGPSAPTGYSELVVYEVAPPGQHFTFSLGDLHAEAALPVTLDAVEAPNLDPARWYGLAITAAWLDREDSGIGGASGPVAPLSSTDLSGYRTVWIVGRAGACGVGPSFDPQLAADGRVGAMSLDRIAVQITVLGIPRRVELPLGFNLVEPSSGQCTGPTTSPWTSPSPSSVAP